MNNILSIIFSVCLFLMASCSYPNNDNQNAAANQNQLPERSNKTQQVKNDLYIMNLFGKIKSLVDTVYAINNDFVDSPKKLIAVNFYYFDTYGYSTREIYYTIDNNNIFIKKYALGSNHNNTISVDSFFNDQGNLSHINTLKYNINDSVIEESHYNPDGSIQRKYINTYNLNGNRTETKIFNSASKLFQTVKYISNFNGLNFNTCFYDINFGLLKEYRYLYDAMGNMIEWSIFDGNENFDYKYKYKYDANNNEIEKDSINSYGELCAKWLSKYDKKFNLIKTSKTSPEIEIESETVIYTYSNVIFCNWTKKTTSKLKFGKPVPQSITYRHIIYY